MRLAAPLIFAIILVAAAAFDVRRILYVNSTSIQTDDMPKLGTSIIQVKPTDHMIRKRSISRFPRFSKFHQFSEPRKPEVSLSSHLINTRTARDLRSEQELRSRLEDIILQQSLMSGMQRDSRNIIQAPTFPRKSCPPGQKLDRGWKKCRSAW